MAARRDTLRALAAAQDDLNGTIDATTTALAAAWERAWAAVARDWEAALIGLALLRDDRWPTRAQVRRDPQAQRALAITRALLENLAAGAALLTARAAATAAQGALTARPDLLGTQLPGDARADMVAAFNTVNPAQVDRITGTAAQRVEALTAAVPAATTADVYDRLTRGTAARDPARAATVMLAAVAGAFTSGLTRAHVIARTETVDAHRQAGTAWDAANGRVVAGWQWVSRLDVRCCPSCWAQHGVIHPAAEPGPLDHQQGRCTRLPVARPWTEFGFTRGEPPSLVPDNLAALHRFDALPEADQLAIMGPARLQLLRDGRIEWPDLSTRRSTPGWRDSHAPTPVRDLAAQPAFTPAA